MCPQNEILRVSQHIRATLGITKECAGMDVIVTERDEHDNISSFSQVWLFHSQDAAGISSGTTRTSPTLQNFGICEVNDSRFNDCLCGSVANPTSDGAIWCKQVGCETQWVWIHFNCSVIFLLT
jgi:hypothetical protein